MAIHVLINMGVVYSIMSEETHLSIYTPLSSHHGPIITLSNQAYICSIGLVNVLVSLLMCHSVCHKFIVIANVLYP